MAKPTLALIPASQGSKVFSVLPSSGVGDFDFSRGSAATRINSQGLIETVVSGQSRLDYPLIDGKVVGCPHHILEPARTNLVTYSEDFSNPNWIKAGTSVVSDAAISPDGSLNASKLVEDIANSQHYLQRQGLAVTANKYSYSLFAKKGGRNKIRLFLSNYFTSGTNAIFDLENGTVVSTGTEATATITLMTDGFYKCTITSVSNAIAGSNAFCEVFLVNDSDANTYTGDGTSGVYIYGAQVEQGSYPTSYIPTTTTVVTRSAETATGAGDATTFSDSEGVLMFEGSALANDGTFRILSLSNGGTSNEIKIQLSSVDNTIGYGVVVGGFPQIDRFYTTNSTLLNNKIAAKYKENDFSLFVNGFEVIVDTNGSVFSQGTLSELSFERGNNTSPFYSSTKQLQYYNSALTDSELEKLTSWISFTDMANGQLYTIE